jgi:exodeoxyribonuclease VII small subunit
MPKTPIPVEQLSYEKAFGELEDVVRELESTPASLEEAINLFERGQALAKRCAQLLEQAELRVQKLSGETITMTEPEED